MRAETTAVTPAGSLLVVERQRGVLPVSVRKRFRGKRKTAEEVNRLGDKTDRASGTMKEAAGKAKRDPNLAAKGRREQIKAKARREGRTPRTPRRKGGRR